MSEMAEAAAVHASIALMDCEPLATCLDEILAMSEAHFKEVSRYGQGCWDPEIPVYRAMETAGTLKIFTLRRDGVLIGYCTMLVRRHHHANQVRAVEDGLYIRPECRGRGAEFIFWIDEQLAAMGARVVYRSVQSLHDHGKMFERQGYQVSEITWSKTI